MLYIKQKGSFALIGAYMMRSANGRTLFDEIIEAHWEDEVMSYLEDCYCGELDEEEVSPEELVRDVDDFLNMLSQYKADDEVALSYVDQKKSMEAFQAYREAAKLAAKHRQNADSYEKAGESIKAREESLKAVQKCKEAALAYEEYLHYEKSSQEHYQNAVLYDVQNEYAV